MRAEKSISLRCRTKNLGMNLSSEEGSIPSKCADAERKGVQRRSRMSLSRGLVACKGSGGGVKKFVRSRAGDLV